MVIPKQEIKIEQIKRNVQDITLVYVEAVLMPNTEIICNGKTIGFSNDVIRIYKQSNG